MKKFLVQSNTVHMQTYLVKSFEEDHSTKMLVGKEKKIDGHEKFVFKNINQLTKRFCSPAQVWRALNKFRIENGYGRLPQTKYRLVEYNEAVFFKPIKIIPIALFGYRKETRQLAKKYGLKCYPSARKLYEKMNKQ